MRNGILASLAVVSAAAFFVAPPSPVSAGAYVIEPCLKSVLCAGLVEHFNMDKTSDWPAFGAFMGQLHESNNTNIGSRAGKFSNTLALDLPGTTTSFLWRSFTPGPVGFFTIGLWFQVDTLPANGSRATFISWNHANITNQGPSLWLYNDGTSTKACLHLVNQAQDNGVELCEPTAISAGTSWYYVAAGVDDGDDTPGGRRAFISVNGAAKTTTTLSFVVRTGFPQVRIGQRPVGGPGNTQGTGDYYFDGAIDELSIWARGLPNGELSLLYNSTSGRSYPFVTGE